jgi:hypothetical protein
MHSSSANKEFTRYKERLERYLEKYWVTGDLTKQALITIMDLVLFGKGAEYGKLGHQEQYMAADRKIVDEPTWAHS